MMKYLTTYVTVAVVVVTAVFAYRIYLWHAEQVRRLRAEVQSEQEVNRLLARISELQESIRRYEDRMPVTEDTSWLVDLVSQLADERWLQLRSVEPQTPQDRGLYTKLGVKLGARCSYHALGDFIGDLESHQKFLAVEQCQVELRNQVAAVADDPVVDVQLVISTVSPKP
jgi:Tfp pilus assembly protein PilO